MNDPVQGDPVQERNRMVTEYIEAGEYDPVAWQAIIDFTREHDLDGCGLVNGTP